VWYLFLKLLGDNIKMEIQLKSSKPSEDILRIVKEAIDKLNKASSSPSLRVVSSYILFLSSYDLNKAQFFILDRKNIENINTELEVPEPLYNVLLAYYIPFETVNIVKIISIRISKNLTEKISKKPFMGIFAACKVTGINLKGERITSTGIIFDPGWSIPINLNNVLGHEVLVTVGMHYYMVFYHKITQSLAIISF
jgi:hypothetical protein